MDDNTNDSDSPIKPTPAQSFAPDVARPTTETPQPVMPAPQQATQPETVPEPPAPLLPETAIPQVPQTQPKKSKKKLIIIALLVALILGGIVGGILVATKKEAVETQPAPAAPIPDEQLPDADPSALDLRGKDKVVDDRTWLAKPTKVEGYQFFANLSDFDKENTIYAKVGSLKDGREFIQATILPEGPGQPYVGLFIATSKTEASLLAKQSSTMYYDGKYAGPDLASSIKVDNAITYKEISEQKTIQYKKAPMVLSSYSETSVVWDDSSERNEYSPQYQFLESNDYGHFEKVINKDKDQYKLLQYRLTTWDGRHLLYQLTSPAAEPKADEITLSDGKKASDDYGTFASGCGLGKQYTILDSDPENLKEAGKGPGGITYYTFYDTSKSDHPLLGDFYDDYNYEGKENPDSYETFIAKKPILLYRNDLKELTAIYRSEYAPQGGCGKPVVYLYPTQPTQVNVTVDADVLISEPAYNTGWSATAQPNGSLTVSGKPYDSLFWEGIGHGPYPDIAGKGFVVSQGSLQRTLVDHLTKLGLNQKERADFLDFWSPRMPSTPFVRLTWLGTRDMDQLAPLHVTPSPDTRIRVFLDFEGLQKPINLQPQRLSAPARQGFTVVEWGGLIRGKLVGN